MFTNSPRQLLCTFTNLTDFKNIIQEIHSFYDVYNKRIFGFCNEKKPEEIYLTYNVLNVSKAEPKFKNTILIHRKKQTNTLYTLNSLNRLVEEETGHKDHSYIIDWNLYQNSLIITGDISIRIIPLKILKI